ncbi:hypothetical protein [Chlorobium sp.]|uniref:hypothetical protein n=1 Tax=Chlorobium sp. TaxID=1095 RepID=UPI003C5D0819
MLILRGKPVKISGKIIIDGADTVSGVTVTIVGPQGDDVITGAAANVSGDSFFYVHQTNETDRKGVYKAITKTSAGVFASPEETEFELE